MERKVYSIVIAAVGAFCFAFAPLGYFSNIAAILSMRSVSAGSTLIGFTLAFVLWIAALNVAFPFKTNTPTNRS